MSFGEAVLFGAAGRVRVQDALFSIRRIQEMKMRRYVLLCKEYTESGLMTEEEMLNCLKMISRDNARTPMQWDDSANAGFTMGTPWISVNKNYTQINAKAALEDKDSVFYYYQKLIRLRHQYEVIVEGVFHGLLER